MRIIIEASEATGVTTPSFDTAQAATVDTSDGGAPSAELLQTTAEALPAAGETAGMDGGTPPAWLLEAILQAGPSVSQDSETATDAGGAPGGG
jgi:hypothetical protein